MSSRSKLKPTGLRTGLATFLVIIALGGGIGFYYGYQYLSNLGDNTKVAIENALGSQAANNQEVTKLQEEVEAKQDIGTKAANFVVPASDYQTQAIEDINRYASRYNVSVSNYGFESSNTPLNSGVNTAVITVTLENPISFTNLMRFIRGIETNTPKLQPQGISIDRSQSGGSSVRVEPLKIEVYTR
jgi:hypothetical protein